MRQVFSRLVVASGLLTLACATALEEGPLNGDSSAETGGGGGKSLGAAGAMSASGTLGTAGTPGAAGTASSVGGKGGGSSNAFGGSATSGGAGTSKGGMSSGGASAGSSSGGKAGSASAGSAAAGSATGGSATAGASSGGSGTAGSASTTCNALPDWTSKTYALGDTVASTCSGVFAAGCPMGQSHKFECNPMAGVAALPWCMSREPGVGNGWGEAWLDKGQCQ